VTPSHLDVRFEARVVGRIRVDSEGRFAFAYDRAWLARTASFAISVSLPLRDDEYIGGAGHAFFANLLPEGLVRRAVCERLGISEGNDYALLRAIGGDCAGALSIVDPDRPFDDEPPDHYELIDDRRLRKLVAGVGVVPLLVGGARTRLSLAGAQDKLPVALIDGRIHLPLDGSASTHILKLPNPRFPHLTANEGLVLGFARRVGLDAVEGALVERTDPPSLLVERFDRRRSGDGIVRRLHQEDLCQAFARPPTQKYEQEGGTTLATALVLVRDQVRQPVLDVRRLIEWQAFNIVAGNSDGHAKNLAILYDEPGPPRLAPFYDIASTREYDRLDRRLALGVGGVRDPDRIGRAQWAAFADAIDVKPRVVLDLVADLAERCLAALDRWLVDAKQTHDTPVLDTLPRRIRTRARRLQRAVS
jgi:serine/threonine-protein kinase HipA